jgi:hypothetical protein
MDKAERINIIKSMGRVFREYWTFLFLLLAKKTIGIDLLLSRQ